MQRPERIQLTDTLLSAVMKLAEGNPGAAVALSALVKSAAAVDPDSAFAEFSPLFGLDGLGLYGGRIWRLYRDVCADDVVRVHGLLRAVQLGILRESDLIAAVDYTRPMTHEQVDEIVHKVREQLPDFGKVAQNLSKPPGRQEMSGVDETRPPT